VAEFLQVNFKLAAVTIESVTHGIPLVKAVVISSFKGDPRCMDKIPRPPNFPFTVPVWDSRVYLARVIRLNRGLDHLDDESVREEAVNLAKLAQESWSKFIDFHNRETGWQ
jgi:hypothetical protein